MAERKPELGMHEESKRSKERFVSIIILDDQERAQEKGDERRGGIRNSEH